MYKKLLVPIALDHGPRDTPALVVARLLADDGASITLLHVVEDIPGYVVSQLPAGTIENNRATIMTELRAIAAAMGEGASVDLTHGHPGRAIVDYAESHGVDCIVIASHRPGLEDYFLGSTAARVVRHAPCAVHVLR